MKKHTEQEIKEWLESKEFINELLDNEASIKYMQQKIKNAMKLTQEQLNTPYGF